MTPEHWKILSELIPEALDLDPAERAAFLDLHCRDTSGVPSPSIREGAVRLIAAHDAATNENALLSPFGGIAEAAQADEAHAARLPESIGRWKPSRIIGRGGMGVVFLARPADGSLDRDVAVKLLQSGRFLADHSKRFRSEQRILSRLEHANIARLYDSGIADDGTPFLVMEHVDGIPITRYCESERLSTRERLKLFCDVCTAVQFAHLNLVVHRDIKPSNIFVTHARVIKLLDFGIAKLLSETEEAEAPLTRTGQVLMTPEYAAPEQVRGEPVTTATDVYSLGVVLYELLVGERPYEIDATSPIAIERIVCESQPTRPSTAAAARQSAAYGSPNALASTTAARVLRGDLDTIILKALSKDPERRYPSAAQLGEDLQNFLKGLPVNARPDTAGYRLRKFVSRHRVGVGSLVAILLALIAGITGVVWQSGVARAEAAKAEATKDFLQNMLASADPYEGNSSDITVVQILDSAATRIGAELADNPAVEADVRLTIGSTYLGLGKYVRADSQLAIAQRQLERVYGAGTPQTIEVLRRRADLYIQISRLQKADSLFRRALAIQEEHRATDKYELAQTLGGLGGVSLQTGAYDESVSYLRRALSIMDNTRRPLSRDEANSRDNYRYMFGIAMHDLGNYEAADSALTLAIDSIRRRPKPWSPFLGGALQIHAWVKDYLGQPELVGPMLNEALAFRKARFGDQHIEVGYTLNDLAYLYHSTGDFKNADSLYVEALKVFRNAVGDEERMVGTLLNNRAALFRANGRASEAIPMLEEAVALHTRILGPDHVDVSYALTNLGHTYRVLGDYDSAERYYRRSLAIRTKALPVGHTDIGGATLALGRVLMEAGKLAEADPLMTNAVAIQQAALGPDHRDTAEAELELARLRIRQGQTDIASVILHRIQPILQSAYGEESGQATQIADLLREIESGTSAEEN